MNPLPPRIANTNSNVTDTLILHVIVLNTTMPVNIQQLLLELEAYMYALPGLKTWFLCSSQWLPK